jgi:hypothetical protein
MDVKEGENFTNSVITGLCVHRANREGYRAGSLRLSYAY